MKTGNSQGFRPDIQGLRAIAVMLVVLYHAHLPYLTGGFVGVDIFFVISGFLITGHIVKSLGSGRFSFADFYSRRVRRILPASFVVLVASLAVAWLVVPPLQLARISRDAAWTAMYVPNLLFAREGTDYLSQPEPSLFQHYWSLGIEEQFYLLWPFILWAIYRLTKRNLNVVIGAVVVLVAASFIGSILLTQTNQPWAFFLLPTRAWELGVGGLVALALTHREWRIGAITRALVGSAGLIALIATALTFNDSTPFPSYYAAIPVVATAAIIFVGPYDGVLATLLQNRAALWVGAVSYSVYLVHWPLLVIPQATNSWMQPLELWHSLLLGAVSIPVGWLCYRFVETPFRKPKVKAVGDKQVTVVWPPLVAAVMCGVLVAGISAVGMRSIAPAELNAGRAAAAFMPTIDPASAPFVGDNLSVRLQDFQSEAAVPTGPGCNLNTTASGPLPACTYGSNPDAPTVALVGDSHAAQWAPALEAIADSGEIMLTAHTRSGCPPQVRSLVSGGKESPECAAWKSAVRDYLMKDPPDVIVITSSFGGNSESQAINYDAGMQDLVESLPEKSVVALLADTPKFPGDPMSCLSGALNDPDSCSVSRDQGLSSLLRAVDEQLVEDYNLTLLDFTNYVCAETCPLIQDNMLVFKDSHHLSKSFSLAMTPVMLEKLQGALAGERTTTHSKI
ncbi:acyltransferase family protein [Leucobacter sp. HY1910]